MRWLLVIALAGIGVLVLSLGFATYTVPTVLVPDRGGVFREGVAGAPQYLHPVWCRNDLGADSDLCNLVYRGLMRLDANGRIVPDLAESWNTIDGRVYQFRLRPNLFWHDGHALTVDDVYFSLTTLQDPVLANIPGLSSLWRSMTVEKLDERTIQITLPQPFAPFIDLMTVGLLPEHIYRNTPVLDLVTKPLTANPIGAGPMRIVEIASNRVRLEPSPFNGGQTPYILALELRFYPDYPSIVAAFDEQQIDGLSTILPGDIRIAAQREDIQLFSSVESAYENVLLNLNNPNTPFFQDRRVREALLDAIDRNTLIDNVLSGHGVVAHSTIAPGHWAYSNAVAQHPYDPDRARALLEQAGWID
ncbi:MAG: ABC transporter substrate-binding protein, partial [Caldilinea sp.]